MQRSGPHLARHRGLRLTDRHLAGVPGERGGEQVGAREHRLALREMRDGPFHRPCRGRFRDALRAPIAAGRRHVRATLQHGFAAAPRPIAAHATLPGLRCHRAGRRVPAGALPLRALGRRLRPEHTGVEAEIAGLALPDGRELVAVDVALGGATHERGPLGEARIVGRAAHAAFGHPRLDLGAAGRERLDHLAGDARNLEPAVGMGLLDPVAQPPEPARELAAVDGPDQHLRLIELLVGHGPPFAVLALHHVGDHGMAVELRIEVARRVVAERGGDHLLPALADHPARRRVLHPGLGGVALDPGKRRLHGTVVDVGHAGVAADQRGQRDRLRGREGDVAAGAVEQLAVAVAAPELAPGAVGHLAFQDGAEDVRVDRTLEPERVGALACPGARLPVLRIVPGVVAVLLVVGDALGGRGDGADRGHHVRSASDRRPARDLSSPDRARAARPCPPPRTGREGARPRPHPARSPAPPPGLRRRSYPRPRPPPRYPHRHRHPSPATRPKPLPSPGHRRRAAPSGSFSRGQARPR